MLLILTLKMLTRIVDKGEHGINMCCMKVIYTMLTNFGVTKTEDVPTTHFFWPMMRRDVERYVSRCTTCNKAKS
jgi:hypothetical protein